MYLTVNYRTRDQACTYPTHESKATLNQIRLKQASQISVNRKLSELNKVRVKPLAMSFEPELSHFDNACNADLARFRDLIR